MHWAVENGASFEVVKLLYDAYPEAAKEKDEARRTPTLRPRRCAPRPRPHAAAPLWPAAR